MASTDRSTLGIINPETPLAFLPPDVADELEVSRYLYVASLGAFAWDLFSNIPTDYKLLFNHKITLATVAYFSSRVLSLTYIITSTIFQIGKVENCQALQIALGICFAAAIPATSLLFLFRILALFNDQKIVVWLFTFLWLAVLGGCVTVPFAIHGEHIGPTKFCVNSGVKPFSSAGIIISAVNDTLVLFAISLRILYNESGSHRTAIRLKSLFDGGAIPYVSKSVLQSGQQYYLITVGANIPAMVMILAPSVSPVYRAMFTIPSVAIENCMACKVYRDVKFGIINMDGMPNLHNSSRKTISSNNSHTRVSRRDGRKDDTPVNVTTSMERRIDPPLELELVSGVNRRDSSAYEERSIDAKFNGLPI